MELNNFSEYVRVQNRLLCAYCYSDDKVVDDVERANFSRFRVVAVKQNVKLPNLSCFSILILSSNNISNYGSKDNVNQTD